MKRRKVARNPISVLSDGNVSETSFGGRDDRVVVKQNFLPLPVDRTIELRWDFTRADLETEIPISDVTGARVKPVVYVAEDALDLFDREELRERIIAAGAKYVKAPTVHVVRGTTYRDERHDVEIPLEESLRLFSEETSPRDSAEKIAFAAELAREADAGEKE